MLIGRPSLGALLIKKEIITQEQLGRALAHGSNNGLRLGSALVALEFCTDAQIARALAEQLEMRFVDLYENPPSKECLALLPRDVALEYGVLPVVVEGDRLVVATRDPLDIRLDDILRTVTQGSLTVAVAVAPESQLQDLLVRCYKNGTYDPSAFYDDEPLDAEVSSGATNPEDEKEVPLDKLASTSQQASAIQIVNSLLIDAVKQHASDIHIEPEERSIRVRYRIHGELTNVLSLQRRQLRSIIARLKIIGGMDISESRKPQDGGCNMTVDGRRVEYRVSTLPGVYGEIAVLRVLDRDPSLQSLSTLGLAPDTYGDMVKVLRKKHGLLLVCGPTGSGKTTTLYASLGHLSNDKVNVLTVEDPVEMRLQGVNQVQVDDKAGRTFAATLRSMLRQDPDIVMVGEIRDGETAEIACRAALTGHLVLSTLHTQHALGTLARIHDMGIPPYIIAAALNGVIAQRLVRRVCEDCAEPYDPPRHLVRLFEARCGTLPPLNFRRGRGCQRCQETGSRGRVGIYELLTVDETLREMLFAGASNSELHEYVVSKGFRTMELDALYKSCQGLIAPEAVIDLGFELSVMLEAATPPPPPAPMPKPLESLLAR